MAAFNLSASMRMSQQQKLSPQMIQTLNIIALPVDELRERIYDEVEKNPALEINNDSIFYSGENSDEHQSFLESMPCHDETLQEHLLSQLSILKTDSDIISAAERLIQNIDEKGYFVEPLDTLLPNEKTEVLQKALEVVHSFDPPGICCNGLQESLYLQALRVDNAPQIALDLLTHYFEFLEKPRAPLILKKLLEIYPSEKQKELSLSSIEEALVFIRTLDPFPARQFSNRNSSIYITPDIIVRRSTEEELEDGADEFIVESVKGNIPSFGLSREFTGIGKESSEARKYVKSSVRDAELFINAVQQRTITVYKAVCAIVKRQLLFFEKGPTFLAPLRMIDIANDIGMHETTISRIAKGKYLLCSWGLFEFKYFFTNAVNQVAVESQKSNVKSNKEDDNSNVVIKKSFEDVIGNASKESVKLLIKSILQQNESEGTKKISDSKLTDILSSKGIKLARRTVAKYRAELNIASSFDR